MAESVFCSAFFTMGANRPPSMATATPTSECLRRRMRSLGPHGIGGGHLLERQRQRLDDEVIDRDAEAGLPSLSFGAEALTVSRSFIRSSMSQSTDR